MLPEAFDTLWSVAALRVAVNGGLIAALADGPKPIAELARDGRLDPPIATRIADVLVASGLLQREGDVVSLTDKGRAQATRGPALAADLAVTIANTEAFVEEASRGGYRGGWRPRVPDTIRAQGTLSHALTLQTARRMTELWPEVGRALERDGAVLVDVGVGAAGGATALCKLFPKLRVVGVDPLPSALIEARANVVAHGLGERIELRAQSGEQLADEHAFDVAFVPARFFDDESLLGTFRALARALKPDGFVFTSAWRELADSRAAAVSRLREEVAGGGPRPTEIVTSMLERSGFRHVRLGPQAGSLVPILASR